MKPEEFSAYRDYFIVDYAHEIVANYGHTLEESRRIATKSLNEDLSQDVSTPGHHLLCLETTEGELIGYLWYRLMDEGDTAFILDFMLFEKFRGQGKGKAAMVALEKQLKPRGVKQIKLRVAYKNDLARGLYEKVGYNVTGYNMSKLLRADD